MLLVATATDPLTRKKRSGDVLLAGGLALGYLTSEVRARQRKGHFLWSEPRGLDETLGWRESVPGEDIPPNLSSCLNHLRCICSLWTLKSAGCLGCWPHFGRCLLFWSILCNLSLYHPRLVLTTNVSHLTLTQDHLINSQSCSSHLPITCAPKFTFSPVSLLNLSP